MEVSGPGIEPELKQWQRWILNLLSHQETPVPLVLYLFINLITIFSIEVLLRALNLKKTPIEFEIFNLLFQNHGNMVSSAQLLKDIWGYSPDDDIETIRVHIRHLRTKIDKISDGKKYIETIYGGGYKLNV